MSRMRRSNWDRFAVSLYWYPMRMENAFSIEAKDGMWTVAGTAE